MSSALIVINTKEHAAHGWKPAGSYVFASAQGTVPLLLAEVASALPYYPLAFQKERSGAFALVALQGLAANENLLLSAEGKWLTGYIPAHHRAYPFVLCKAKAGEEENGVLCFDNEGGLYRENPNSSTEQRFFDDEGKPQATLENIIGFLKQSDANRKLTAEAVAMLETYDLFEPWKADAQNAAAPMQEGLYKISQSRLYTLDAEALERLQKSHALSLAYAQIFSMPRVAVLKNLHERNKQKEKKTAEAKEMDNITSFFNESKNETIKFNF